MTLLAKTGVPFDQILLDQVLDADLICTALVAVKQVAVFSLT